MHSSSKALDVTRWSIASGLIAALALTGCASTPPVAFHELPSASKLQPVKDQKDHFRYTNPEGDFRNYTAVIVDPVTIYTGSDSQFVPDDARRMMPVSIGVPPYLSARVLWTCLPASSASRGRDG